MSNRFARLLLWLGAMGSGAGLVFLGISRLTEDTPLDLAALAALGIALVVGAALIGVGLIGFSLEVVQWINRVLPDPPRAGVVQEPPKVEAPNVPRPAAPLARTERPPPDTGKRGERVILDVTPEYLVSLFDGKLAIQANKLVAPYLDKWIYVSGPLGNVLGNGRLQVTWAFDPARRYSVYMYFDEAWQDRFAVLMPGQHLTVLGRITDVDGTGVKLKDCELVPITPSPPASS
jgi:hypothetical protein